MDKPLQYKYIHRYIGEAVLGMEDIEKLGENASEMINKLSRQLEHARDLNDLFTRFVSIDELDLPSEIKELIKEKIQICKDDKTE